jgi:hypothetical protein
MLQTKEAEGTGLTWFTRFLNTGARMRATPR